VLKEIKLLASIIMFCCINQTHDNIRAQDGESPKEAFLLPGNMIAMTP
jgi:hypothetical protein